jgi:hypothetical protein
MRRPQEGVIGDIVAGSTVTIIAAGVGVCKYTTSLARSPLFLRRKMDKIADLGIYYVVALIALVFLHFFPSGSSSGSGSSIGNGGSTPTQTTPQPTQTQATTTSSATSTATPTEYLLVAQDGVSVSAFQEYTDTLSSNPEEAIINSPFAIARVVNLTDSEKAQVQSNSLINSVTQNLRTVANPFQYIETREPASSPRLVSETLEKRTQPARGTALINSIIQRVALLFRNRSFADKLGHLSQLSATWFDNSIEPYNGEDYVFEAQPGNGIWIYVLDDGVLYTHSVSLMTLCIM